MTSRKQIFLSLAFAIFLLAPALLKIVGMEPYPAVILPSGAGTISLEPVVLHETRLYGERAPGWERIDAVKFLEPVPVWYLDALARRGFGLEGDAASETREWIRRRLMALAFSTERFRLTVERVRLERGGKEMEREFVYEKTFSLH